MTEPQPAANPFPEMWSTAREAFLRIARDHPDALCAGLAAASGISDIFMRLAVAGAGPPAGARLARWLLIVGPVWGIVRLYGWAAGTWAVARALGGSGTYRHTCGAFAWAALPMVGLLLLWVPALVFLGSDFFLLGRYAAAGQGLPLVLFALMLLAVLGALLWSLVLLIRAIGLRHGLGLLKSLASVILGLALLATVATVILERMVQPTLSISTRPVRPVHEAAKGTATDPTQIQESTMRFMIIGKATRESEAGILPKPEAFAAMQAYHEDLVKAGILLGAEGLAPTSKGARVRFTGDKRTVIDGPFAETKEVIAGFSIIRVNSLEEAIEWVKRAPNLSPNGETEVEIRKLMDVEDFGEEFTPSPEIAKVKFE